MAHMTSLLGFLLVLNALKHHSYADQDYKIVVDKGKVMSTHQKEILDGFITTRKFGYGGRKMMRKEGSSKEISGAKCFEMIKSKEENNALVKSLQGSQYHYLNHQKNMKTLKPKTKKGGSLGNPRSERVQFSNKNPNYSNQDSKKLPTKARLDQSHSTSHQYSKGEAQSLLEATKEIVNLMNKDYKGMDRPRRKPPINNNLPVH